jgi:hypothetical protein
VTRGQPLPAMLILLAAACGGDGIGPDGPLPIDAPLDAVSLSQYCRELQIAWAVEVAPLDRTCDVKTDCAPYGYTVDGFGLPTCDCKASVSDGNSVALNGSAYTTAAGDLERAFYTACAEIYPVGRVCDEGVPLVECSGHFCRIRPESACFPTIDAGGSIDAGP